MAVKATGRRKLEVNGERFIWYVAINRDGPGKVLHVMCERKELIVMYPLDSSLPDHTSYVVVLGRRFEGAETGGVWRRFLSPPFCAGESVLPSHVRGLILWCLDSDIARVDFTPTPYSEL